MIFEHVVQHLILSTFEAWASVLGRRFPRIQRKLAAVLIVCGFLLPLPLGLTLWTRWFSAVPVGGIVALAVCAVVGVVALLLGYSLLRHANRR